MHACLLPVLYFPFLPVARCALGGGGCAWVDVGRRSVKEEEEEGGRGGPLAGIGDEGCAVRRDGADGRSVHGLALALALVGGGIGRGEVSCFLVHAGWLFLGWMDGWMDGWLLAKGQTDTQVPTCLVMGVYMRLAYACVRACLQIVMGAVSMRACIARVYTSAPPSPTPRVQV
jgi:hypothetical protein